MAAAARTVRLVVFPGGFNWPLWVAEAQGWLSEAGIALQTTLTPGSVFQLTGLIDGRFDLAITLADNVVAYREGQGEVPAVGDDLVALMAADTRVFPTLVTLPGLASYAALRGRALSVDALTTGYAFVLRAMLEHGGLGPDDYRIESVGGARERYLDLLERRHAGCLLNSPYEALLAARGFNPLDTALGVLGAYEGQVLAARAAWAAANADTVTSMIRVFLRAVSWLREPAHRDEAFAIFCDRTPGADAAAAATAHAVLFDPVHGFPADGAIDPRGLEQVVALRARYGRPAHPLASAAAYCEPRYLAAAAR